MRTSSFATVLLIGGVQLTDAVNILNFLFSGGRAPTCEEAADADDNGAVQLTDAVRVLNFLFAGGDAPPAPGVDACGPDPDPDDGSGCDSYASC